MDAFIAIFRVLEIIGNWAAQWRKDNQFKRKLKLEAKSAAYEKLAKATNARNNNRLSRRDVSARGKPDIDSMSIDKYQRD